MKECSSISICPVSPSPLCLHHSPVSITSLRLHISSLLPPSTYSLAHFLFLYPPLLILLSLITSLKILSSLIIFILTLIFLYLPLFSSLTFSSVALCCLSLLYLTISPIFFPPSLSLHPFSLLTHSCNTPFLFTISFTFQL